MYCSLEYTYLMKKAGVDLNLLRTVELFKCVIRDIKTVNRMNVMLQSWSVADVTMTSEKNE